MRKDNSPTSPKNLFRDLVKINRKKMTPRVRRSRPKRKKIWQYPIGKERTYARLIKSILKRFSDIALPRIRQNIEAWCASYKPDRADSTNTQKRKFDGFSDEYAEIDEALDAEFGNIFLQGGRTLNKAYINSELQTLGIDTSNWNQVQWIKFAEEVTGLASALPEPWLMEVVNAWKNTNYSLIKSLSSDYIKEMNRIVHSGVMSGKPWDEVMREIRDKDWNITQYKAKFLARDQIGKLNGQLAKRRQQEADVELYEWSTSRDERVRDSHANLEGKICSYSDPSVYADSVQDALAGAWQDREAAGMFVGEPGEDFQCFSGNVTVRSPVPVEKLYRRWYSGKVAEFIMSNRESFTCTLNHPIYRADGCVVSAHLLNKGDKILNIPRKVFFSGKKNIDNGVASFKQVFNLFSATFPTQGVAGSPKDFHGDGIVNEEINIISLERPLGDNRFTNRQKRLFKKFFSKANTSLSFLPTDRHFLQVLRATGFPSDCGMRFLSKLFAFQSGHFVKTDDICLRTITEINAIFLKTFKNGLPGNIIFDRQGKNTITIDILFDNIFFRKLFFIWRNTIMMDYFKIQSFKPITKIIRIARNGFSYLSKIFTRFHPSVKISNIIIREFSDHVYNLQNKLGWYNITNKRLKVKNCRCSGIPVMNGLLDGIDEEIDSESEDQADENT